MNTHEYIYLYMSLFIFSAIVHRWNKDYQ